MKCNKLAYASIVLHLNFLVLCWQAIMQSFWSYGSLAIASSKETRGLKQKKEKKISIVYSSCFFLMTDNKHHRAFINTMISCRLRDPCCRSTILYRCLYIRVYVSVAFSHPPVHRIFRSFNNKNDMLIYSPGWW